MLALDIRQHQGARDPIEHVGRGRAAAPLLEPRVPGRADIGALRHLLAAQAGRAATLRPQSRRPPDRASCAGPADIPERFSLASCSLILLAILL